MKTLHGKISAVVCVVAVLFPRVAEAHLLVNNSALFSGLAQPLTHGVSLLFLLAFALWTSLSLRDETQIITPVAGVFLVALAAGVVCRHMVRVEDISVGLCVLAMVMAFLSAVHWPCPKIAARWALPAAGGGLLGFSGIEQTGLPWLKVVFFTAGISAGTMFVVYFFYVVRHNSKHPLVLIIFRVVASWIVAIAAMTLTSLLAKPLM